MLRTNMCASRPINATVDDRMINVQIVMDYVNLDLFRGGCAVKGNVAVAGHVKRVDRGDA